MPVVDIRSKGGNMPEPEGDTKVPQGEKDPVVGMEEAYYRGKRVQAFERGAGIENAAHPPAPPVKESQSLDVAGVVKAQSDLVGTLIGQIVDLVKVKPAAGEDPLLKFVLEELRQMRARADNAPDPLGYLEQSQATLATITQRMKASLGLGEGVRVGTGDIGGMISLEEAKMEREERQRRWETEKDEKNKQWLRENQRWEAEFGLRLKEFEQGQKSRESNTDMFSDLIGSVIENLNTERASAGTAARPAAAQPAPAPAPASPPVEIPPPQPFECPECHNSVTPPAGLQPRQEVKCPHCEASYTMQVAA